VRHDRLTPASDDELTTKDHLHRVTYDLLVARKIEARPRSWGFLVPLIADPMPQSLRGIKEHLRSPFMDERRCSVQRYRRCISLAAGDISISPLEFCSTGVSET
jgi:hypothetical protein